MGTFIAILVAIFIFGWIATFIGHLFRVFTSRYPWLY